MLQIGEPAVCSEMHAAVIRRLAVVAPSSFKAISTSARGEWCQIFAKLDQPLSDHCCNGNAELWPRAAEVA